MKNKSKLPFLRTENLVVKELPSELLIYDLDKNKAFCLNETARLIMDECDGKTSIDEAIVNLNRKFKAKVSEEMIWMVIEQLQKADFIEKDYQIPMETTRVTRRKILQSAAALGIALPMITSLVAPSAVNAQSGCLPLESGSCNLEVNNCCPGGTCIDIGDGFTTCAGCAGFSQPCQSDDDCCPTLLCVNTESGPTGFQCFTLRDF